MTIYKKDGSPSPYFWSDEDGTDADRKTVYKKTGDGIKRMRGVHFDAKRKKIRRH
jgi:hypothetical protein